MKNTLRHKKHILVIALLLLISLAGCSINDKQQLENHNWKLSWSDEFDGVAGSLPDAAKWSYDIGTGNNGWGNSELEYYTNRPQNISQDGNGNLVITAIKESYQGSSYTSARIKTKGIFEQKYGRFEAKIKSPYGQGLWPAFWMLGNNVDTDSWPLCGEIDIMEIKGQLPSVVYGTLHGPGYSGANAISNSYTLINNRFDTDFHIFAVEWNENKIDFFVDNYLYKRINKSDVEAKGKWVYDHPFFLILNLAVGGNFLGFPNSQTTFPQKLTVDYVRVYQ
jgi:beta-glucanase (GH16 family)